MGGVLSRLTTFGGQSAGGTSWASLGAPSCTQQTFNNCLQNGTDLWSRCSSSAPTDTHGCIFKHPQAGFLHTHTDFRNVALTAASTVSAAETSQVSKRGLGVVKECTQHSLPRPPNKQLSGKGLDLIQRLSELTPLTGSSWHSQVLQRCSVMTYHLSGLLWATPPPTVTNGPMPRYTLTKTHTQTHTHILHRQTDTEPHRYTDLYADTRMHTGSHTMQIHMHTHLRLSPISVSCHHPGCSPSQKLPESGLKAPRPLPKCGALAQSPLSRLSTCSLVLCGPPTPPALGSGSLCLREGDRSLQLQFPHPPSS